MAKQIGSEVDQALASARLGIADLRDAFERSLVLRHEILTHWETMAAQYLMGLRDIGDRLSRNFEVNVRAIFDFADDHLQTRSASEIWELQRRFFEEQSESLADQVKDIENLLSAQIRAFSDEIGREPVR